LFAIELQDFLYQYVADSDINTGARADLEKRFIALRGSGLLPRGRENRETELRPKEIANSILGLATSNPNYAAIAALTLGQLRPVGGNNNSFFQCPSLIDAISTSISTKPARDSLHEVTLSPSLSGNNVNGTASITYDSASGRATAHFVSPLAISLISENGLHRHDKDYLFTDINKKTIIAKPFFEKLALKIESLAYFDRKLRGDGPEYLSEEAAARRRKKLGSMPGSRFLSVSVETAAAWPKEECLIDFNTVKLALLPFTKEHSPSVHLDLARYRLSDIEGHTIINNFLSMIAWCSDQYATSKGGYSGSSSPVPQSKISEISTTSSYWHFSRSSPKDPQARRSLSHYREGLNAERSSLISYAFLSYYKILELVYGENTKKIMRAIDHYYTHMRHQNQDTAITYFDKLLGDKSPGEYMRSACRIAVAHASIKSPSDADNMSEIRRLYTATSVLKLIARRIIMESFSISTSIYSDDIDHDPAT
tara:strand:+ start:189 stop:1634 length:1446 start_codon:yes stop_codon:yes gene_type:complete